MTDSTLSSDRAWPHRPDFNQFKRQAKELLKAYRAGDANAVAEVERHDRTPDRASFALQGKCQYIPNSFVPVHPEQPGATIVPKNDLTGGNLMSKQSVRLSVVEPW